MRRYIYIIVAIIALSSCQKDRIIPDGELAQIFKDAFVVNAIATEQKIRLDSLNIYEPIFEKYGYTTQDVQYTIGNFSKRKSARLSDVVEGAIALLEKEGVKYDKEVAILDTIRAVSQREMSRVLLERELILLEAIKDTTKFNINIEDIKGGKYVVSFDYLIDSLDENIGSYRSIIWFENRGDSREYQKNTSYLQRNNVNSHSQTVRISSDYDYMKISIVDLMGKRRRPHVKVRDVKIEFTPLADAAEELMFEKLLPLKIYSDELLPPPPTDSL